MPTSDDREVQILALWRDRPPERRSPEHIVLFYDWLVAYAPWLLPPGAASLDRVRSMVEAHIISPEQPGDTTREPRQK
jgi:hypothetical protein